MPQPTWVFVVGTYRTASTTQYRMVEEVVQSTHNGFGIGYHTDNRLGLYDEETPPQQGRCYVVCKVFKYLPVTAVKGSQFLKERRLKVIGTVRDPRDVFVSMRTRRAQQGADVGDEWFAQVVGTDFPVWFGQFMLWARTSPALISKFENVTADPLKEVQRIGSFLRVRLSHNAARAIAQKYTTQALRDEGEEIHKNRPVRAHPVLPSIPPVLFGTSGHWKEHITQQQADAIYSATKEYMDTWGYGT